MEDFIWEERQPHEMFFVFISLHFTNENKFSYLAGLLDMPPGSDRQPGELARLKNGTEAPLYRIQRRRREK